MTPKQLKKQIQKTECQLQIYKRKSFQYKHQIMERIEKNSAFLAGTILSFFFIGWAIGKTMHPSSVKRLVKKSSSFLIHSALIKPLRILARSI